MEFIEKVDVRSVKWILTKLSNEFVASNSSKIDDCNFTYIKRILQKFDKQQGCNKVLYKKSNLDTNKILRDYGEGIQGLPSSFRGLICKNMFDIDIVNCHIKIIENICKKHNITCNYLTQYCENRTKLINDNVVSKIDIIKSMNKKQKLRNCNPFLELFDLEMKHIQQQFLLLDEFQVQKQMAVSKPNQKNMEGSFMSYVATTFETQIIHHCIDFCKIKNINIGVLMFDGFMVYSMYDEFCADLSKLIKEKMNFDISFINKPQNNILTIPTDWICSDPIQMYLDLKRKYENDYKLAYIEKSVCYSYKIQDEICFFTYSECSHHFDSIFIDKTNFFDLWVKDDTKQVYGNIGVFPHDSECPNGTLNLWTGFSIEKVDAELVSIDIILNHIMILVNRDELVYNFILDWIANMFQFPSRQSILVALTGKEGSGKSVLVDFLTLIMGRDKSIEIQDPESELFGSFNGHLSSKVFININEIGRKDINIFFDKLKSKITSPTITIHNKGQKQYTENNLGHFLATTNNENVFNIKEGSRRFFLCETNNELIGNVEYFNVLYTAIKNKNIQYSFYKAMMVRHTKTQFTVKDIPITQAMKDAFELNRDPIEDYAIEFLGELSSDDNYFNYKQFLQRNGYKFEITKKSFEMKFGKYIEKYNIIKKRKDTIEEGKRITTIVYSHTLLLELDK